MQSQVSESTPDPERQELIDAVTRDAASYLGLDLVQATPGECVAAVNEAVTKLVFGEAVPFPEDEEPHLLLGCLWGAQMVREFQWEWVNIRAGDIGDVAVASPSRDMVIFPFTFVQACIQKRRICTVELSFNMLLERKGEVIFHPAAYEDMMGHIHHIVPPYTLEAEN